MDVRRVLKKSVFYLLMLFSFYALAQEGSSIITISSAQKTEYSKDKDTGDEIISFFGGVSLSVTSDGTEVKIQAEEVAFNRASDMLSASGGVTLVQTQGGTAGGQTIYAQSLLFNTKTMEGVFDNARVFQTQGTGLNLPTGSTLVVNSEIFGRDSSSTVVFKNGELTFCEDENPHWKIKASRIWLLPGQEFAFLNAVLSIGNIPVLYLPAFYYPKDELIFHPVFGYTSREGYYFQTTTYLYGRKPLNASSSSSSSNSTDSSDSSASDVAEGIFNFMKSTNLKQQEREGLVLHNLDEDFTGSTSNYVKLLADYYTNLGGMFGLDASFTPKTGGISVSRLSTHLYMGFSTTVFSTGSGYTHYAPSGSVYYDSSSFLGMELPFRYSAGLAFEITSPFRLSVSLPVYSDPFFNDDFNFRDEDMDWFGFFMNNPQGSASPSSALDSSKEITSFSWNITSSYSVKVPDVLKPYISTLSLGNLSSSVQFSSKQNTALADTDPLSTYSPSRKFFYPSQITPVNMSAKISGTLLEYPVSSSAKKTNTASYAVTLDAPEELSLSQQESDDKKNSEDEKTEDGIENVFSFPELKANPDLSIKTDSGLTYRLTYSLSPAVVTQMQYDGTKLNSPEDFDWGNIQSFYVQLKSPLEVSSLVAFRSNLVSVKNTLLFNPVYQDHPFTDGYSPSLASSLKNSDYAARKLDLTESNQVSLRPLLNFPVFSKSSINWDTSFKLLRTSFTGTVTDPDWDYLALDLTDKDSFSVHTVSASFVAEESPSFSQTLTLSSTLPPQLDLYKASLSLTFPFVTASLSAGVQKKSLDSDEWKIQPLQQNATVRFFKNSKTPLTLTESFNFNIEENHSESLRFTFAWSGLNIAYSMQYTYGYDFDQASYNWKARSEKDFIPINFSLSYSLSAKTYRFWQNRVSLTPSLNTSIVYDCLRPTSSYFTFAPTLGFTINNFLDISFTAQTRNDVIYRYFQNLSPLGLTIPGETNPFVDLFNSFAFWGDGKFYDPNQTKRKSSGFKLKSLSVKITHDLHDWKLNAEFSVSPRLITEAGKKQYSFDPYFTLSVAWKPLPSIKTQLTDKYGTWEFE